MLYYYFVSDTVTCLIFFTLFRVKLTILKVWTSRSSISSVFTTFNWNKMLLKLHEVSSKCLSINLLLNVKLSINSKGFSIEIESHEDCKGNARKSSLNANALRDIENNPWTTICELWENLDTNKQPTWEQVGEKKKDIG